MNLNIAVVSKPYDVDQVLTYSNLKTDIEWLVIFFNKDSELIFRVSFSTSTKIGFNPACTSGHKDVGQQTAGIIASSPGLKLFFLTGLQAAKVANRLADEPELTIKAYFTFNFLAKSFSKSTVFLDIVSCPDAITLIPEIRSWSEKAFSNNG